MCQEYHSTIRFFLLDEEDETPVMSAHEQALEDVRLALSRTALAEAKAAVLEDRVPAEALVEFSHLAMHWSDTRSGWRELSQALADAATPLATAPRSVRRAMKAALLTAMDHLLSLPSQVARDAFALVKPGLDQCKAGLIAGATAA